MDTSSSSDNPFKDLVNPSQEGSELQDMNASSSSEDPFSDTANPLQDTSEMQDLDGQADQLPASEADQANPTPQSQQTQPTVPQPSGLKREWVRFRERITIRSVLFTLFASGLLGLAGWGMAVSYLKPTRIETERGAAFYQKRSMAATISAEFSGPTFMAHERDAIDFYLALMGMTGASVPMTVCMGNETGLTADEKGTGCVNIIFNYD